ncbi:hypothetical protein PG994_005247 [Apiospora phragmitis]|uniref:Nephrocystin 3-like N-terminal domain-containing protein n=1 Tax=Apiospora phragmitis TaxID=2905665 RepID=A0ABR1VSZ5_9PEZI
MEALAALGLASNVVSFVDFSWKLLTGANAIYASGSGVADDVQFLDSIIRDAQRHGNVSDLGRVIRELQMTHERLGVATKNEVSSLKQDIQEVLENLADKNTTTQMKQYFQQHQSQELSPVVITELSDQMRSLAYAMDKLETKGMEAGSNQQLLKKLHFSSISTRERKIEKAYEGTFQWLVNSNDQMNRKRSCLDFITWLRDGDGVCWLHGKPGSGKSTFMKFAFAQKTVQDHFEHWSKDDQLVTASFYFWYAGSRLQKSLEGLLRTLLFEILRHIPEVIPSIASDPKLAVPVTYDEDWDLETPFLMYEFILLRLEKVKFCFFIDGLDEFQDEEHQKRQGLDQRPASARNIRQDKADLTRNDIHAYVSGRFTSHEQFSRLRELDSNYEDLISEVVDRAQGVFLLVRLVVQTLLEGFTFHDSVPTLRRRLTSFPGDLDEFFYHIITNIPAAYRRQAAKILKVATEAEQPRLLVFYQILDEIIQGENLKS